MNKNRLAGSLAAAVAALLTVGAGWAAPTPAVPAPVRTRVAMVRVRPGRTRAAANVNHQDPFGATALHHAVDLGQTDLVASLLAAGARENIKDDLGQTPLILAAKHGDPEIVQLLLENGTPDLEATDQDGMTALDWATLGGHKAAVALLIGQR